MALEPPADNRISVSLAADGPRTGQAVIRRRSSWRARAASGYRCRPVSTMCGGINDEVHARRAAKTGAANMLEPR